MKLTRLSWSWAPGPSETKTRHEVYIFYELSGFWTNFCLASVCVPCAVRAMNFKQVPHILNHLECRLSNAARTWSNFSHCMVLDYGSLLQGLSPASSLSPPEFPFAHDFSFLPPLSCMCFGGHVSVCCHPLTKSCGICGPVKWTCVAAWAAQTCSPHTLCSGHTLGIWHV